KRRRSLLGVASVARAAPARQRRAASEAGHRAGAAYRERSRAHQCRGAGPECGAIATRTSTAVSRLFGSVTEVGDSQESLARGSPAYRTWASAYVGCSRRRARVHRPGAPGPRLQKRCRQEPERFPAQCSCWCDLEHPGNEVLDAQVEAIAEPVVGGVLPVQGFEPGEIGCRRAGIALPAVLAHVAHVDHLRPWGPNLGAVDRAITEHSDIEAQHASRWQWIEPRDVEAECYDAVQGGVVRKRHVAVDLLNQVEPHEGSPVRRVQRYPVGSRQNLAGDAGRADLRSRKVTLYQRIAPVRRVRGYVERSLDAERVVLG